MKNRLEKIILIALLTLGCKSTYGQELNENYMLFSKSDKRTEYLEFKNDSIVERKPYIYHTGGLASLPNSSIFKEYRYEKLIDTIRIYEFETSNDVVFRLSKNNFLENSDLEMVYVRRNIFDEFPDVAVRFENETYWLDSPKTSNGIIKSGGRKNRKLARIMRKKDTTNLNFEIYKGYKAFEKFGYENVFGIIEVSEK